MDYSEFRRSDNIEDRGRPRNPMRPILEQLYDQMLPPVPQVMPLAAQSELARALGITDIGNQFNSMRPPMNPLNPWEI